MDPNELNQDVIDEFRANGGTVGGMFEGMSLLLLHHVGAKSGIERVSPLVHRVDGEALVIFASKAGAPTNPDWYHNLLANPATTVEFGADTVAVTARVAEGADRTRIWEAAKTEIPMFADYEASSGRTIPVVVLDRS